MIRPLAVGRSQPEGPGTEAVDVVVADDQTDRVLDVVRWQRLALAVLADAGVAGPAELQVSFVDEVTMAELNVTHMGHDGPTDVLSFPLDADPRSGGPTSGDALEVGTPLRLLGDVIICPVVAERNAPEHAGTVEDELALLTVHGILHVLGMDHATAEETEEMQARERELLDRHHRRPR